ncbi:hypothetical protein NESM_000322300 [Novymonas esmeraldas]|uniref:Uncharacterized protein n=1 Tax=Novymonas esmeraldas TaxID=1808958 RepID=A0AAW0ELS0_9TRYP
MFRGYWIVADMDGTLTPTPSRAHGEYLSLSHSRRTGLGFGARYQSCLPWLLLFLERGGSLCVVSTAGKRMWSQLYPDLAPALFHLSAAAAAATTTAPAAARDEETPGPLYLCGFTGAALFRSRSWEAVWADMDRLHPHWRAPPAGDACAAAAAMVPPAGVALEEWAEYREQGGSTATDDADAATPALTTMDAATCALAVQEGRLALVRFFEHAAYVCGHDAARAHEFFAGCLSTKYHSVFAELLRGLLAEARASASHDSVNAPDEHGATGPSHVCFAASRLLSPAALAQHGYFLTKTGDALVDAQVVPRADGTVADGAAVAQVVVMGIPMRYFDRVFPPAGASPAGDWHCCPRSAEAGATARQRLEDAGLELKSQPNSVCLHRRGVDKATCVRWLLARHRHRQSHPLTFELSRALAFGDVPETVDAPLTTFPPMGFLSLSPKSGAAAGLVEMERVRGGASGRPHMWHVGGEEEGTAVFLEELLTQCTHEDQQRGQPSGRATPSRAVNWFSPDRVAACAERARERVEAELRQRKKDASPPPRPRPESTTHSLPTTVELPHAAL